MAVKTIHVNPGDIVVFKTVDHNLPPNKEGYSEQERKVKFSVQIKDKRTLKVSRSIRPKIVLGSFLSDDNSDITLCSEVL